MGARLLIFGGSLIPFLFLFFVSPLPSVFFSFLSNKFFSFIKKKKKVIDAVVASYGRGAICIDVAYYLGFLGKVSCKDGTNWEAVIFRPLAE